MAAVLGPGDVSFCEGARLLQDSSSADIGQILVQRKNGNLMCSSCFLVVADANEVNAVPPDSDWPLLASCHLQACASLHDRRAAFACYACLERGKLVCEPNLSRLKTHIEKCELMRAIRSNVPAAVKSSPTSERNDRNSREDPFLSSALGQETMKTSNNTQYPPNAENHSRTSTAQQPLDYDDGPPLPNRPRTSARRAAKQNAQPEFHDASEGFRHQDVAAQDYSPTVPRRKEIRAEPMGLPTPPSRAPPAPPQLTQPGPPPQNSQNRAARQPGSAGTGLDRNSHPSPLASHNPQADMYGKPESAKVRQLVNLGLGISPGEAEGLLSRAGGDINLAAEMKMSG